MSILFKEALTVAALIGLAMLIYIGTLIMIGRLNGLLLKDQKFWRLVCGNRKEGPTIVLGVIAVVLMFNGYITESPWFLGAGFVFVILSYVKYRDTLVKDPFDRDED